MIGCSEGRHSHHTVAQIEVARELEARTYLRRNAQFLENGSGKRLADLQGSSGLPYLSPSSLPVELWMKCILVQAGHTTGEWRSFASSGGSASQCCTFIPVLGHLNRMGWAMIGHSCQSPWPGNIPYHYLGRAREAAH